MKILCLEGIDGCGKTSLQKMLSSYWIRKGLRVLTVRDPGTSPLAEAIRPFACLMDGYVSSKITNFLAYCCARSDLVDQFLRPAKEGKIVEFEHRWNWWSELGEASIGKYDIAILDRWWLSTYVYQCKVSGNDLKLFWKVFHEVNFSPDVTVIVDDDPEEAFKRTDKKSAWETLEKQKKIREAYLQCAEAGFPEKFMVLEPGLSLEDKFRMILAIEGLLDDRKVSSL